MNEKSDKPEDKPEFQGDNSDASLTEAVIAAAESEPSGDEKKGLSGILKFFIFLLIVTAIVAGGLANNGQLEPMLESAKATINEKLADLNAGSESDGIAFNEQDDPASEVLPTAEFEALQNEQDAEVAAEQLPEFEQPETLVEPEGDRSGPSPEQVNELLATIDGLRNEISNMEASQRALSKQMHEQQQANLQARLRWITDPASHLPQLQLAWNEISMLPNLSDRQRESAAKLHQLASDSSQALQAWQAELNGWADKFALPEEEEISVKPEHPWLAWWAGQFHLRRAPTAEARRLVNLRDRLLKTGHLLSFEKWPNQADWLTLRNDLLLAASKMNNAQPVELALPEDFTAIQRDIESMRSTAAKWAEGKKGEI